MTLERTLPAVALGMLAATLSPGTATAGEENPLMDRIEHVLQESRERLIGIRRDLHEHPEPSGQEERTARIVAEELRGLGLEVETGVGGFGVVGTLRGASPGPVVAYRSDMDAVRTEARDPVPFRSVVPGVYHVCGHDVHVAVALGVARALAAVRDELPGTVRFLFQPSEENAQGARAMIEDGALRDPQPEAIYAVHCAPVPVGNIASIDGLALPAMDLVTVAISGSGDLEGRAASCADVIARASTIGPPGAGPERNPEGEASAPEAPAGGFIYAGVFRSQRTADDAWTVQAIVRVPDGESRERARGRIDQGVEALDGGGLDMEVTYTAEVIPPVVNDSELVGRANPVIASVLGPQALTIVDEPTPFFSEDFARFQQKTPGALFFLGISNPERGIVGLPHSPDFAADEDAILVGARAMAAVLLDRLAGP
jgi:amidohydrolase